MKYRIKNRSPVCVYNFLSFSFNPSGSPLTEQTVLYFEEQSCNKQINPSETLQYNHFLEIVRCIETGTSNEMEKCIDK